MDSPTGWTGNEPPSYDLGEVESPQDPRAEGSAEGADSADATPAEAGEDATGTDGTPARRAGTDEDYDSPKTRPLSGQFGLSPQVLSSPRFSSPSVAAEDEAGDISTLDEAVLRTLPSRINGSSSTRGLDADDEPRELTSPESILPLGVTGSGTVNGIALSFSDAPDDSLSDHDTSLSSPIQTAADADPDIDLGGGAFESISLAAAPDLDVDPPRSPKTGRILPRLSLEAQMMRRNMSNSSARSATSSKAKSPVVSNSTTFSSPSSLRGASTTSVHVVEADTSSSSPRPATPPPDSPTTPSYAAGPSSSSASISTPTPHASNDPPAYLPEDLPTPSATPTAATSTSSTPPAIRGTPMAAPPSPASKSRASRSALAKIQGGGGLGPKGNKTTALEKVLSKTRPRDLPPKAPEEDKKHLREFEEMMAASVTNAQKRSQAVEQRKLVREALLQSHQQTWERDVLPNWKVVLRDEPRSKTLRQMWWKGTMPPRHRGRLWHQCIGNSGAVGRSAHQKSVVLARSLINSTPTRFPPDVLAAIDADIAVTLPSLKLFQTGRPMHSDLKELLLAWSVFWREKPYYPEGSSCLAALLLINMAPQDAFLALINIVRKSCLSFFYNDKKDEMDAFYRIFDTLLADTMPKVYRNFSDRRIQPSTYLFPWITTCYVQYLPFDLATHIMDVFVLEGDSFLFRTALALLQSLEARLFNPDADELQAVFRGTDKGARAVVARETGREPDEIGKDEAYEEMGCDEDTVFRHLGEQTWNEALWDRLVARELPE